MKREFASLYSPTGVPWILPEKAVMRAFCSLRPERLLMERREYGRKFHCFDLDDVTLRGTFETVA